jgi:Uma2 family endonuclease
MENAVQEIPKSLVYEMVNGQPVYYKGYQDYLSGSKQIDEIMGSSKIQALIVAELIFLLKTFLGDDYLIFTNEVGLQFSKKSWRAADIAVVKAGLVEKLDDKYLEVPPELVIEIDTKAALHDIENPLGYYQEKTEELLQFGVKKVVWIFSDTEKVMVAEQANRAWQIYDWADPISIEEGLVLDMNRLLRR